MRASRLSATMGKHLISCKRLKPYKCSWLFKALHCISHGLSPLAAFHPIDLKICDAACKIATYKLASFHTKNCTVILCYNQGNAPALEKP